EPADAVVTLDERNGVACASELLSAGEARRTGTDDSHRLASQLLGRLGLDPAFVESAFDDAQLDLLDGYGIVVDAEDAGGLAGRGAEAAGELREVVRGVETVDRHPPLLAVHQVVPVWDDVAERAALVAEGDRAVHAAGRLRL